MIITTTDFVPRKKVKEILGLVRGNTIQAKHIGKDIVAGFRNIVGGEIKEYTDMLTEAREIALRRMVEKAEKLGADAVINVRFMTSAVMGGAAEILAYGTAVKLEDES
ncbi:MAG: YbjQ family protein [Thermoplasmata archaeon]|nr:MAG: YbjQ family protein [Thermoplasmata archaeon]KAA0009445.1 MAG: YbjQ family protein [Thermoplasmata archaeon]